MNYLKLDNIDIYKGEGELFITKGDSFLLKVVGKDCMALEQIIKAFEQSSNKEEVYKLVSTLMGYDKYNNLINWLIRYDILIRVKLEGNIGNHKICIWGNFQNYAQIDDYIISHLDTKENKFELNCIIDSNSYSDLSELKDVDLVLIFSPIFSNYKNFLAINSFCYKNKIPALHIDINMSSFTIGPFSDSKLNTPCLECYSKRKMVNFENKDQYLKFVKLNSERIINKNNILDQKDLGLLLEYLKLELGNYFSNNSLYLYARSITYDMLGYNIIKSKILRIPSCPVCDESSVIMPFN